MTKTALAPLFALAKSGRWHFFGSFSKDRWAQRESKSKDSQETSLDPTHVHSFSSCWVRGERRKLSQSCKAFGSMAQHPKHGKKSRRRRNGPHASVGQAIVPFHTTHQRRACCVVSSALSFGKDKTFQPCTTFFGVEGSKARFLVKEKAMSTVFIKLQGPSEEARMLFV